MSAGWTNYTSALAELVTADARSAEERARVEAAFHASGEATRRTAESEAAALDQVDARLKAFSADVARLATAVEGVAEVEVDRPLIPASRIASTLTDAERALRKVGETKDWLARYRASQVQAPVAPAPVAAPPPVVVQAAPATAPRPRIPRAVVIAIAVGVVAVVAVVVGIVIGASS